MNKSGTKEKKKKKSTQIDLWAKTDSNPRMLIKDISFTTRIKMGMNENHKKQCNTFWETLFQLEAILTRLLKVHREAATWHFFFFFSTTFEDLYQCSENRKYIVLLDEVELTRTWTRKPERLRTIPFLSLVSIYVLLG